MIIDELMYLKGLNTAPDNKLSVKWPVNLLFFFLTLPNTAWIKF